MKSIRYCSRAFKLLLLLFVISFIGLGVLGTLSVSPVNALLARIFTAVYFGFFVILLLFSGREKTLALPSVCANPLFRWRKEKGCIGIGSEPDWLGWSPHSSGVN